MIGNNFNHAGTGLRVFPQLQQGIAAQAIDGTGDVSPSVSTFAASGLLRFIASGSETFAVSAPAGIGAMRFTGTASETFAVSAISGSGALRFTGSFTETFGVSTFSASGVQRFIATGAESFIVPALSGTGSTGPVGPVSGAGAVTLPVASISGAGAVPDQQQTGGGYGPRLIESKQRHHRQRDYAPVFGRLTISFAPAAIDGSGRVSYPVRGRASVEQVRPRILARGSVTDPVLADDEEVLELIEIL